MYKEVEEPARCFVCGQTPQEPVKIELNAQITGVHYLTHIFSVCDAHSERAMSILARPGKLSNKTDEVDKVN